MKVKNNPFRPVLYLGIVMLILLGVSSMIQNANNALSYAKVVEVFEKQDVREFSLSADGDLVMELYSLGEDKRATAQIGNVEQFHNDLDALITQQHADGILVDYHYPPASGTPTWQTVLLIVLTAVVVIILIVNLATRMGGGQKVHGLLIMILPELLQGQGVVFLCLGGKQLSGLLLPGFYMAAQGGIVIFFGFFFQKGDPHGAVLLAKKQLGHPFDGVNIRCFFLHSSQSPQGLGTVSGDQLGNGFLLLLMLRLGLFLYLLQVGLQGLALRCPVLGSAEQTADPFLGVDQTKANQEKNKKGNAKGNEHLYQHEQHTSYDRTPGLLPKGPYRRNDGQDQRGHRRQIGDGYNAGEAHILGTVAGFFQIIHQRKGAVYLRFRCFAALGAQLLALEGDQPEKQTGEKTKNQAAAQQPSHANKRYGAFGEQPPGPRAGLYHKPWNMAEGLRRLQLPIQVKLGEDYAKAQRNHDQCV